MNIPHLSHQIHMMFYRVFHTDNSTMYTSIAMLVLAAAFMLIGASRWVEFLDYGFSRLRRSILVTIHLIGCVVLGMAFALQAIDVDRQLSTLGMALISSAFALLFPIHIYLGLLRRIRTASKN